MHTKIFRCILFLFLAIASFSTYHDAEAFTCGTDTVSYDGKNYQTVQIGAQCWFKENLNVGSMLGSGATMPSDPAPTVNEPNTVQKWCYDNNESNCTTGGGFYTWAEANGLASTCNATLCAVPSENQGICPSGWHVPTDNEFKTLEIFLGMTQVQADTNDAWRGSNQGSQMSSFTAGGTNASGFSALLIGSRYAPNNGFVNYNTFTNMWSSQDSANNAWIRVLYSGFATVYRGASDKNNGLSVRCIRNALQVTSLSTSSASSIAEREVTLNAHISDIGTDNPMRSIEYGTTSGIYTSECTAGTGGTGAYSCNVANLTPNTTYYFRAKATNSAGTSYGSEMSFTTLALQDTTITDPDGTDMTNAVTDGYFTLNTGTITNTDSVTTAVNVTVQDTIFNALFPQNTTITEQSNGNFNFQNLVAQNVTNTVQAEQPTSRAAVRIGIPGEKLNFSQNITLTVSIGEAFNGQTLDILYQQEGESTWNTHGTCTVSNGECIFTTNHATIYTVNGNHQTTGDTPMNLNVEIQETLSMDCFDPSDSNTTVSLGTTTNPGLITAGTPAVGQSRCTVTTNADQGYYLTLTNANPSHATLTHTDLHTATLYEITDTAAWNETTKATTNWTAPTTKGLSFSVITFPEADTTHNQFDGVWNTTNNCPEGLNPDTNDYAGIPTTPQAISAVTSYQSSATTTNICYKVDVPASQPSGQYSGQVMFTATSDASGYWE